MVCIFVYGTLLVGEVNHHVAAPYLLHVEPGTIRGKLYDFGPYPGLVTGGDQLIEGEWFQLTDEALAHLDALEEYYGPGQANDYERVWVGDALRKGREGWVYVWNDSRGCPVIAEGSWRAYTQRKRG